MKKKAKKVKLTRIHRSEAVKKEVVNYYYTSGESLQKVSEKYSIPVSTIGKWCTKFAKGTRCDIAEGTTQNIASQSVPVSEAITDIMNKEQEERKRLIKDLTVDTVKDATPNQLEALFLELKSSQEEAKKAREDAELQALRADINEEIIKVASKNLNIDIRKKAGTKR